MSDKEINKPHDQVERNNQGDRTSESTSKDSVISGDRKDHQALHQEASKAGHTFDTFSDNNHDQSFKAIQPAADTFGIDFGDGTIETSKGKVAKPHTQEFFEAKAQGAMKDFQNLDQQPNYRADQVIAANVTNPPVIRSDATLPALEAPAKETKISQGLPNDYDAHTFYESGEALRPVVEATGDLGKAVIESGLEAGKQAFENATHPFRGKIDSTLKEIPESAWSKAYESFPQFQQTGLSKQQTVEVMKAIVRNELYHYDSIDQQTDDDVKAGKTPFLAQMKYKPEDRLTLGYAQLSISAVHEREAEYPEQVDFKGHEKAALMDPENTPVLVAATLVHNIEMYRRHQIPVTEKSLGYSYNPPAGRILPSQKDLDTSNHAENVMRHLAIIRGEVQPKPDER